MSIILEKMKELPVIPEAFYAVVGRDFRAFRFIDTEIDGDEPKVYSTFKLVSGGRAFVLKKSEDEESYNAEVRHYKLLEGLPVPEFLGAADGFILLGFVEGSDLLTASDEGVRAVAKSLSEIMNAYPMGRGYADERYARYLKRLEKRAGYLSEEPELARAFSVFFERAKEIPLTMSNSDLLPINVLFDGERAILIDWAFGGFMPYALDIARFIAHGRTSGNGSPFRMTDGQKRLFADLVYDELTVKPERAVYDRDILLAEFNECVEILEYYLRDKTVERGDTFRDYYPLALRLAAKIV